MEADVSQGPSSIIIIFNDAPGILQVGRQGTAGVFFTLRRVLKTTVVTVSSEVALWKQTALRTPSAVEQERRLLVTLTQQLHKAKKQKLNPNCSGRFNSMSH